MRHDRNASPPFVLETHGGVRVLRDDLMPGGTKARALPVLFTEAEEYVYASPAYGYAQVALAHTARAHGRRATVFVAQRGERHPRTADAAAAGAQIMEVPVGYMSVVRARAREYCARSGAVLLPFGLDDPRFLAALAEVARAVPLKPKEVWAVAGSGVLIRALQLAWPRAAFHAVQIGAEPDVGRAQLHQAPEKFEQDAQEPPPFRSCSNYDAKAWRFVSRLASPGALFWNVA